MQNVLTSIYSFAIWSEWPYLGNGFINTRSFRKSNIPLRCLYRLGSNPTIMVPNQIGYTPTIWVPVSHSLHSNYLDTSIR